MKKRLTRRHIGSSLLLLFLTAFLPAQPDLLAAEDPEKEADILKATTLFLERVHLLEEPLDDEMSRRAFEHYLESYDPLKIYFLAEDVAEFEKYATRLDDQMKAGDLSFGLMVFERFLERARERLVVVEELLEKEFDFGDVEYFESEGNHPWAKDAAELRDRWRRRLEFDLLALEATGITGEEALENLRKRYTRMVERLGKERRGDVLSRFVNAVASSYDPHSVYMDPKAYEDFQMGVTNNYQGVGAVLSEEDGFITVRSIIEGGEIEAQGEILEGDRIVSVGQGEEGPMVDIIGWRTDDAVKLIRGEEGTRVRLGIQPAKGGPVVIHTLTRRKIELTEGRLATSEIVPLHEVAPGERFEVGIINLPSFYRDVDALSAGEKDYSSSTRDVARFLAQYREEGVDAVILDLRLNGGGFLPEAVGIAGLFIDEGPVVQVNSGRRTRVLDDEEAGVAWEGPLVVLTSKASASASEIVAGAMRDWKRGLVVGDSSTHGKGTVQTTFDMARRMQYEEGPGALGIVKLTIQQFYLPAGESTQRQGVPSDVVLPSWLGASDRGEATLDHALPADTIPATSFEPLERVDAELIEEIARRSAERRAADPHFRRLAERLEAYRAFRESEHIPLQREAYKKLRAALDEAADEVKEEVEEVEEQTKEAESLKDDPWFREVLAITADYSRLLARRVP